ncbi:MAG TPA: hypothetical protein VGI20_06315 [Rhizomicrobium sp.]|jgi:hypothetical protein
MKDKMLYLGETSVSESNELGDPLDSADDLLARACGVKFSTILADPPWRFDNKTGKIAPEHRRLNRYQTLGFEEIEGLPVSSVAADVAHLYLWVPNALLCTPICQLPIALGCSTSKPQNRH